jgi:hypothetical protein
VVKSLKKSSVGLYSVALAWKEPAKVKNNPTTGYTVKVLEVNGKTLTDVTDKVQVGTINENNTGSGQGTANVIVTGLTEKTKYRIEVQAVADGLGVKSATAKISVTTLNPAKYPVVAGFKATVDKNTNAVNLSWTESKVPETVGYEIEIHDANNLPIVISGVTDTLIDSNGMTGKVTLPPVTGLEPGKYTVLVRAVAEGGIVKSVKDAKKSVTVKA